MEAIVAVTYMYIMSQFICNVYLYFRDPILLETLLCSSPSQCSWFPKHPEPMSVAFEVFFFIVGFKGICVDNSHIYADTN